VSKKTRSCCEKKVLPQENENSETGGRERERERKKKKKTEEVLKQQEKTGALLKRPRRLPSGRNKVPVTRHDDFLW
jgi:hypothetical protein